RRCPHAPASTTPPACPPPPSRANPPRPCSSCASCPRLPPVQRLVHRAVARQPARHRNLRVAHHQPRDRHRPTHQRPHPAACLRKLALHAPRQPPTPRQPPPYLDADPGLVHAPGKPLGWGQATVGVRQRSEEHTSELQS